MTERVQAVSAVFKVKPKEMSGSLRKYSLNSSYRYTQQLQECDFEKHLLKRLKTLVIVKINTKGQCLGTPKKLNILKHETLKIYYHDLKVKDIEHRVLKIFTIYTEKKSYAIAKLETNIAVVTNVYIIYICMTPQKFQISPPYTVNNCLTTMPFGFQF